MSDDSERTIIAPRTSARIGTTLNGIYQIESLIAVGGMGEVYKGRAMQTGDAVAIKMIRPDMARDEAVIALFRREAAALHNLYNEAIVRYYVFAIDPVSETPYLAMEFVDGQPLSDRIKERPLSVEEADILRQRVAPGLHAAHRLGIVHRDISPDNIILPGGDPARAKIIDFGIARSSLLSEGTVIGSGFAGKYNYVSPEQLGLYGGEVTGRSDMYSFALVLAEAVTGRALDMRGSQVEILDKRRRVPDLSTVDARLRPLLARMLAPDPKDRPADMAEVASWQPPSRGKKVTATAGATKQGRSPLPLVPGIAILALLAGGGFYAWTMLNAAPTSQSAKLPGGDPPALSEQPSAAPANNAANAPPTLTEPPPPAAAPAPTPAPTSTAQAPSAPPPAPPAQPSASAPPSAPAQTAQTVPAPSAQRPPPPPPAAQAAPASEAPPLPPTAVEIPVPKSSRPEPKQIEKPAATAVLQQPPSPGTAKPPAQTPAATGATLAEPRTPAERIERYVRDYDGGRCFFLWPIEIGERRTTLEGFGSGSAPFVAFDNAFKAAQGFEAHINLRPVTPEQCPMVDFLRQPGVAIDRSPKLQIGSFNMKSGDILNGSVEAGGGQNIDVVLIGDDGLVYNLAGFMKREAGKATFNIKLESTGGAARPQTVLALVSREALPALSGPNPTPASDFFANLKLDLARQSGTLGIGIKYFRIE